MRSSSSIKLPGLFLLFAAAPLVMTAPAEAAPPAGGGAGDTQSSPSIGGFTAPSGAQFDPNTTADPGLLDRQRERAADATVGPAGDGGYDIVDTSAYAESSYGQTTPDFHIVQEGDTLSGLCSYYYGDMYLWPKIWSYNPHITNAHWIFPGDRIRLTDPYETVSGTGGPDLGYAESYNPRKGATETYLLERFAFIDEEEIDKAMEVVGGGDAAIMMGTLDTAYVGYKPENPPIPGERLSVYRKKKPVYDISVKGKKQKHKQGQRIGWLVEVVGEVYVRSVADKSAETEVVEAVRPIERGQRVGELKTRFTRVSPSENTVSANGLVVETIRDQELNGEAQFVIVNLGAQDGVRRGNTFDVVQKGDAYTSDHRLHLPYDQGHPRRVLARLMVLQVEGDSALTVVIHSLRETVVGDHVEIIAVGEEPPDFEPYNGSKRDERRSNSASGSASSDDGSAEAELSVGVGR